MASVQRWEEELLQKTDKTAPENSSFIFSFTSAAFVYPLLFFILSRVKGIDSKTEKRVRIMVYRPWLEKSCVQKEILEKRNPSSSWFGASSVAAER